MSGFSYLPPQRWEILGELGSLQVTGNTHGDFELRVCSGRDEAAVTRTNADAERAAGGDGAVAIYRQLVAHIERGLPLAVSGADALRVATVMDAIRKSDETGNSVRPA